MEWTLQTFWWTLRHKFDHVQTFVLSSVKSVKLNKYSSLNWIDNQAGSSVSVNAIILVTEIFISIFMKLLKLS